MTTEKLPSKREITPASSEAASAKRATYTDEFKRTAVERLHSREQSATDLAMEMGIRRNMLYKWAARRGHAAGSGLTFGHDLGSSEVIPRFRARRGEV
jgi:transposase